MSREREAAIHRELARLHAELADEIEGKSGDERPSEPRPRRERRPRALTPPAGEATPIVRAAAARLLRERGYR